MTRSRPAQLSFSSGELSPLLYGRSDYQRYQTGLRSCVGFIPLRQGAITRAPGTIFRGYTRQNSKARRIPFEFAENDTLALEFTDGFMRVWRYGNLVTDAGVPYELATPYDEAALDRLQWVQSADVIYLVDGQLPMQKLSRFALNDWTIEPVRFEGGPFKVQNLDESKTIQASARVGTVTLTGTGDVFEASWIGNLLQLEPTDFSNVAIWTGNTAINVGDQMQNGEFIYELVAGANTGVNAPVHTSGTRLVDRTQGTQWRYVSDKVGIVRITGISDPNTATANVIKPVPSPCVDDPTYRWSPPAWTDQDGHPEAIEIFDQSLFAGFTASEPRTVWASTLGDFEDFEPGAEADAAFAYTIAGSQTLNSGNWLRRARRGIYIGALGEVYRGFSNAEGQRIGPTTFDADLEATDGCSKARPIAPYGYPVYITKDNRRIQEVRYSFEEDGGKPVELSLPAEHLGAKGFREIVWQSSPQRLGWIRCDDGELVVMVYDPIEEVLGFARYPIADGFVESLDVVSDSGQGNDILTLIVRREIDGSTVRMVEEQAITYGVVAGNEPIERAIHLFAATQFNLGSPGTVFFADHLAGQDVYAWTDGGEFGPITVAPDGRVELPVAVTEAIVGLLDETQHFETLPIVAEARDGSPKGRFRKLCSDAGVIVHKTAAGRVFGVERDTAGRTHHNTGQDLIDTGVAQDLSTAYSGPVKLDISTGYSDEVSYRFEPVGGAPMTIAAVIPNIEEQGA